MKKSYIILLAMLAVIMDTLLHEGTHAVVAMALGTTIKKFTFFFVDFVDIEWTRPILYPCLIDGSAAIANLVCMAICMILFHYVEKNTYLSLFLFYLASFSLFSGFGYLFFDPLVMDLIPVGDWSQIIIRLGSSWILRITICLIGALGILYGYFWVGKQAHHFLLPGLTIKQTGFFLCVGSYLIINTIMTCAIFMYPLEPSMRVTGLCKHWFGMSGFCWAYFIQYFCRNIEVSN